ncbi:hypothetical protein AB1Y20_002273 [Prymnesium parvum]|uniref:Orc1-like AAA ATPase domain-containing protein n=1 Tax=Prymnesium parvum TaxID=97485 RepID=A0AB34JB87_PRYPA
MCQAAGNAGGGVLMDEDTRRALVEGVCEVEALDPIKVKGKEEKVPVFRPTAKKVAHVGLLSGMGSSKGTSLVAADTPRCLDLPYIMSNNAWVRAGNRNSNRSVNTIGRQAELAMLWAAVRDLQAGRSRAVIFQGEAGLGKTHLVDMLRILHAESGKNNGAGVPTVKGTIDGELSQLGFIMTSAKPVEQTTPFYMFRDIFARLFTQQTLMELQIASAASVPKEADPHGEPSMKVNRERTSKGSSTKPNGLASSQSSKSSDALSMETPTSVPTPPVSLQPSPELQRLEPPTPKRRLIRRTGTSKVKPAEAQAAYSGQQAAAPQPQQRVKESKKKQSAPRQSVLASMPLAITTLGGTRVGNPRPLNDASSSGDQHREASWSPGASRGVSPAGRVPKATFAEKGAERAGSPLRDSSTMAARGPLKEASAPLPPKQRVVPKRLNVEAANEPIGRKRRVTPPPSPLSKRRARIRKRWRDAYSTVLAFLLPLRNLNFRHSVRPQADAMILDDPQIVQLAPLLSAVLPVPIADNEVTKHMHGESRMGATITVMIAVLAAKLRGCATVLAFDDVHWMDSSSWALLCSMVRDINPMLVCLTSRPPSSSTKHESYDELVKYATPACVVELNGLQGSDLEALLCDSLEVSQVPSSLVEIISDKSDGNPFWVKEFVKSMLEDNVISADGKLLVDSISEVNFPSSVEGLVTSRMDRIPAALQLTMKVASVLEADFDEKAIRFLAGQLSLDIDLRTLDKLCAAEMLVRSSVGFSFKHKYLQDVSYSLLPEELKEQLHRAAAKFYEQVALKMSQLLGVTPSASSKLHETDSHVSIPDSLISNKSFVHRVKDRIATGAKLFGHQPLLRNSSNKSHGHDSMKVHLKLNKARDYIAKLCYHWSKAGDKLDAVERAISCHVLAGDQALSSSSLREAREILQIALNMVIKHSSKHPVLERHRGPLLRRIGQCHMSQGEKDECQECLQQCLQALGFERRAVESTDDRRYAARFWAEKFKYSRRNVLRHVGLTRFLTMHSPQELQVLEEAANAYELLGRVSLLDHRRLQAGYFAIRALNLGLSLPVLTPVVARAYASLCLVESASHHSRSSMVDLYKRKALETAELLGELGQVSFTLQAAGVHYAGNARWEAANEYLSRAAEIALQLQDKRQWEECISHQGHLEYYRGDFAQSKRLYMEAQSSASERGDKQMLNRCNAGIAANLIVMGDTDGAMDILKSTNSYGQQALCLLRSNQAREALDKALAVKDRFKGVRTKYYVLKAFASTAEVILQLLEGSHATAGIERQPMNAAASASPLPHRRQSMWLRSSKTTWGSSKKSKLRASCAPHSDRDLVKSENILEDSDKLSAVAVEWIDKMDEFGKIYPVARPRALLLRGRYLMIQGIVTEGISTLKSGLAVAKSLRMDYEEGLAYYELGVHQVSEFEATKLLTMAREKFQSVGAAYDVSRCTTQLETRGWRLGEVSKKKRLARRSFARQNSRGPDGLGHNESFGELRSRNAGGVRRSTPISPDPNPPNYSMGQPAAAPASSSPLLMQSASSLNDTHGQRSRLTID